MKPMAITNEMQKARQAEIDSRIEKVNSSIERAVKHGRTQTCFDINTFDPYYSEVRRAFEKVGYRIVPTGYIGGVWQRTEEIIW